MASSKNVCVVGAGVIGLSTAYSLANCRANFKVTLISEKFSPYTTGDGAAGKWDPSNYHQTPVDHLRKWGSITYKWFHDLTYSDLAETTGVSLVSGYHYYDHYVEEPFWKDILLHFRHVTETEIDKANENGYYDIKCGWFYTTFFLDCEKYLPWLMDRFKARGGSVIQKRVKDLSELAGEYDCVVNCSGLGSYHLANDKSVYPIRGQLARVNAPWIKHFMNFCSNKKENTYIMPRANDVVLGLYNETNCWNNQLDEKMHEEMLQRAHTVMPSLKNAKVTWKWSGLRPSRPSIRLESDFIYANGKKFPIIHNYGHAASGITLHLGCALDATKMVAESLGIQNSVFDNSYDFQRISQRYNSKL